MNQFKIKCDKVFEAMKNYSSENGEKLNMDKMMISKEDEYFSYTFNNEHELNDIRSISKAIVCLSLGIAIDKKIMFKGSPINLDTKIWSLLKNSVNLINSRNIPRLEKITLKHMLNHTMGFNQGLMFSKDIQNMKAEALIDYVFNTDIAHEPGEFFIYSNAGTFAISVLIEEVLGQNLSEWINELLFKEIDITNYEWKNYGKYCAGATGLKLSIDDLHKIGIILTNKGGYKGKRIVSEEWVSSMMTKSIDTPRMINPKGVFPKEAYGYDLWLSRQGKVCYCDGTDGQYLIMIPEEKIVITTMGDQKNMRPITECMKDLMRYV